MPFKSKAQRAFMFAKHPKLAEEFQDATPENAKLPEHVKKMSMGGSVPCYDEGGQVQPTEESPIIKKLRDLVMGSGGSIGSDQKENDIAMGVDSSTGTPKNYAEGGMVEDDKDASVIPEDIMEYVDKMHKEQRESRPDEAWRITPPEKPEHVAPYKKDEDAEESQGEMDVPKFAKGGVVPGYDEGGEVDPNELLQSIAPQGAGALTPPVAPVPAPAPAPALPPGFDPQKFADKLNVSDIAAGGPEALDALDSATAAPARAPAPAPNVPRGTPPASTDQDFMDKANKMLGLNPQEQAAFMNMLGKGSQKAQIGAGIAGIGDAIASGGTLGKVNPGALNKSEDLIQNAETRGLGGLQTIRGNQEKAFETAQKLEAQDPNSPLSKYAQKAYAGVGKKIGIDLSHASAGLIADVTGKGVEALNSEYEAQLKQMGLGLQAEQIKATTANQRAERAQENTKERLAHPILAALGKIPDDTGGTGSGPVKVNSMEEYKALPAGTHYVDSHGTEKVKK